jgi:hypothetical protein
VALRPRLSPGVPLSWCEATVWDGTAAVKQRTMVSGSRTDGCETDRDLFDLPLGRREGFQSAILADEHLCGQGACRPVSGAPRILCDKL